MAWPPNQGGGYGGGQPPYGGGYGQHPNPYGQYPYGHNPNAPVTPPRGPGSSHTAMVLSPQYQTPGGAGDVSMQAQPSPVSHRYPADTSFGGGGGGGGSPSGSGGSGYDPHYIIDEIGACVTSQDLRTKLGAIAKLHGGWEVWLQCELALHFQNTFARVHNTSSVTREVMVYGNKSKERVDLYIVDHDRATIWIVELKAEGASRKSAEMVRSFNDDIAKITDAHFKAAKTRARKEERNDERQWTVMAIAILFTIKDATAIKLQDMPEVKTRLILDDLGAAVHAWWMERVVYPEGAAGGGGGSGSDGGGGGGGPSRPRGRSNSILGGLGSGFSVLNFGKKGDKALDKASDKASSSSKPPVTGGARVKRSASVSRGAPLAAAAPMVASSSTNPYQAAPAQPLGRARSSRTASLMDVSTYATTAPQRTPLVRAPSTRSSRNNAPAPVIPQTQQSSSVRWVQIRATNETMPEADAQRQGYRREEYKRI